MTSSSDLRQAVLRWLAPVQRQPGAWSNHLRNAGTPVEGNKGDNLYAASRVGIDPANGEIKWHFQTTPREGWDFDGVNEVVPFVDKDGNSASAPPTATASSTF